MKCPNCNHPNPAKNKFCEKCGARLGGMICPNCGFHYKPGATFCQQCGQPLAIASASSSTLTPTSAAPSQVIVEVQEKKKRKFNPLLLLAGLLVLLILCCVLTFTNVIRPPEFITKVVEEVVKIIDPIIHIPGPVYKPAQCKDLDVFNDWVGANRPVHFTSQCDGNKCSVIWKSSTTDLNNMTIYISWDDEKNRPETSLTCTGNAAVEGRTCLFNKNPTGGNVWYFAKDKDRNCVIGTFHPLDVLEPVISNPPTAFDCGSLDIGLASLKTTAQWEAGKLILRIVPSANGKDAAKMWGDGCSVTLLDGLGKLWGEIQCSKENNLELLCKGALATKTGSASIMTFTCTYSNGQKCTLKVPNDTKFNLPSPCGPSAPNLCGGVCQKCSCSSSSCAGRCCTKGCCCVRGGVLGCYQDCNSWCKD